MVGNQKWIPCDKDHPDAICKSLTDLPSDKVSYLFECQDTQYLFAIKNPDEV